MARQRARAAQLPRTRRRAFSERCNRTGAISFPLRWKNRQTIRRQEQTAPPENLMTMSLEELEREHILRVLNGCDGNRERAAAILGISTRTLYRKLREYELESNSGALATEA